MKRFIRAAKISNLDRYLMRIVGAYNLLPEELVFATFNRHDLEDPDVCRRKCKQLHRKLDTSTRMVCFTMCGYMAKVMDCFGLEYECCVGVAGDLTDPLMRNPEKIKGVVNHCWVEHNNKYYETFLGQSNITHLSVIERFKF